MRNYALLATRTIGRPVLLITASMVLTGCFSFGSSSPPIKSTKMVTLTHEGSVTKLEVSTSLGNITISQTKDVDKLTINAEITTSGHDTQQADDRLAKTKIEVKDRGALGILIEPTFPEPRHGNERANLTIQLPALKKVDIVAGSSTGNITIGDINGAIKIETSTGSIIVRDSTGDANLDSSTGDVVVLRHIGGVDIDTSTGDIKINQQSGGAIKADSSTGSIRVTLADEGVGPVIADTSTDDIELSVGTDFRGRIDLEASLGKITIDDHDSRVTKSSIEDSEGTIHIGDTGPTSSLGTSIGDITVTIRGVDAKKQDEEKDEEKDKTKTPAPKVS